ncbi:LysR family transcriptional regulator, partial [Serratia fonticola]
LSELQGAKWFLPAVTAGYYINIEGLIFPHGNIDEATVIYGDSLSIGRKLVLDHDYLFAGPKYMMTESSYQELVEIIPVSEQLPDGHYSLAYRKSHILTPIADMLIKLIRYTYNDLFPQKP